MAKYRTRWGVRVSTEEEKLPLSRLSAHPWNPERQDEDKEQSRVFTAEIKKEGAQDPITVIEDRENPGHFLVIDGWRRTSREIKLGIRKSIIGVRTEPNPDPQSLFQLACRSNTLKEGYSESDQIARIEIAIKEFNLAHRKNLERPLEALTGISSARCKQLLAIIRRRQADKKRTREFTLTARNLNYARPRAERLFSIKEEKAELKSRIGSLDEEEKKLVSELTKLIPPEAEIKGREARLGAVLKKLREDPKS